MKCHESDSDRTAEVIVKGDNKQCVEYKDFVDEDGALCCYIPLNPGEKVSVACSFKGTSPQGTFDLVVDGILRNAVPFNNKKGTRFSRSVTFDEGYVDKTFRTGGMVVAPLESDVVTKQGEFESVGKVEVRISILRIAGQSHVVSDVSYFAEADTWKQQYPSPIGYQHLQPTSQIEVVADEGKPEPSKSIVKRVRSQMKGTRPGNEPWATFKFFYRSQEAIINAKFEKADKKSHMLNLGLMSEGALATRREGTSFSEESTILPGTITRDASEDTKPAAPRSSLSPEPTPSIKSIAMGTSTSQHNMSDKLDHSDLATSSRSTAPGPAELTLEAESSAEKAGQQVQLPTPTPSPKKVYDSKFEQAAHTTKDGEGDTSNDQRKPTQKPATELDKQDKNEMSVNKTAKDGNQNIGSERAAFETSGSEPKRVKADFSADEMTVAEKLKQLMELRKKNQDAGSKRSASEVNDSGAKRVKADFTAEEKLISDKMKLLEERRKKRQEARERADDAEARRKAALQRRMEELERAIEEEERMEFEAEEDCLRNEEALRAYAD